jgi:hypothetical protein
MPAPGGVGTALSVALPGLRELGVWAHRVTDEGDTVPLVLAVSATGDAGSRDLGVTDGDGRLTTDLGGVPTTLSLRRLESTS